VRGKIKQKVNVRGNFVLANCDVLINEVAKDLVMNTTGKLEEDITI
jgi:hypothetical protein